jgi:hypothetical protein
VPTKVKAPAAKSRAAPDLSCLFMEKKIYLPHYLSTTLQILTTDPVRVVIFTRPTGWLLGRVIRPSPIHGAFLRVLPLPLVFMELPLADDPAPRPAAAAAGAAGG